MPKRLHNNYKFAGDIFLDPVNYLSETTDEGSTSEESADTGNDINQIETLVEDFGKVLVNISLLGPPDILENDIKKYYGD